MSSSKTKLWDKNRNHIFSSKGGWRVGEAVYNHGYSMMDDLVGHISYFQLLFLNVTGRLPEKRLADWLEGCFICLSWPDSRIWCNQISALAGTSRTRSVAATTAGAMASDSLLYGPGVIPHCMQFIQNALRHHQCGISVKEIIDQQLSQKSTVPGFARPIAKGDERVIAMQRVSMSLGYEVGAHETLAMAISDHLSATHDECINFGGYMVAFLADQGLSAQELNRLTNLWVTAGVQACYAEAADKPAGSFLPMRCEDIRYTGKPPRPLPE
jgi:uncharacterized protein (DUF305 family)